MNDLNAKLIAEGRETVVEYLGLHPGSTYKEIYEDNDVGPHCLDVVLATLHEDGTVIARHDQKWGTGTRYSLKVQP